MSESHSFLTAKFGLAQGMSPKRIRNSLFLLHLFLNPQRRKIRITGKDLITAHTQACLHTGLAETATLAKNVSDPAPTRTPECTLIAPEK